MQGKAFSNAGGNAPARKFVKWFSVSLLLAILLILMYILPGFHDYYFGVAKNESSAVGALQKINSLEEQCAVSHPDQGFACELSQLGPPVTDPHDPNISFLSGHWSGYTFAITDCVRGANGSAAKYDLTGVPAKPHVSGIRAFCSDQSGAVFYDLEGAASGCLRSRKQLSLTE